MRKLIPILAALAAATPALAADPAPVLAADRAFAAMSASKGPRAAFMAYLAPSATMVNMATVQAGTPNQLVGDFPTSPTAFHLNWQVVGGAMSEDAMLGVTWGMWTREVQGHASGTGAYTTVWHKADGRWQVIQDGGSDRLPPMQAWPPRP